MLILQIQNIQKNIEKKVKLQKIINLSGSLTPVNIKKIISDIWFYTWAHIIDALKKF